MKFLVAESGVAFHNQDEAVEHIRLASEATCDAIKFQIYDDKVINQAPKKWRKHLKDTQIGEMEAWRLMKYGELLDIEVFFTPMFVEAVDWLEELEVKRYKVRNKDSMNDELLLRLSQTNKPVYISRNGWPFKQHNFHTVFVDEDRPTSFGNIEWYGYPPYLRHKDDIKCKEKWKFDCNDSRHKQIEPSKLAMFFYDGYSCHCNKILAPYIALDFVDYVEVHTTLNTTDDTLPDWEYSHSYTDMLSLARKRTLLNTWRVGGDRPKFECLL